MDFHIARYKTSVGLRLFGWYFSVSKSQSWKLRWRSNNWNAGGVQIGKLYFTYLSDQYNPRDLKK